MAELFRLVKDYNLPRVISLDMVRERYIYIYNSVKIVVDSEIYISERPHWVNLTTSLFSLTGNHGLF